MSTRLSSVVVWIVYCLGVVAAAVIVLSAAVAGVVSLSSDEDAAYGVGVSVRGLVLWGGLVAVAAATWIWRRRRRKVRR